MHIQLLAHISEQYMGLCMSHYNLIMSCMLHFPMQLLLQLLGCQQQQIVYPNSNDLVNMLRSEMQHEAQLPGNTFSFFCNFCFVNRSELSTRSRMIWSTSLPWNPTSVNFVASTYAIKFRTHHASMMILK